MHLAMDESQPVPGLVSAANAMPEEPLAPDPASPCPANSSPLSTQCSDGLHRRTPLFMLKQAIVNFQSHSIEYNIARKLAHCYKDQVCNLDPFSLFFFLSSKISQLGSDEVPGDFCSLDHVQFVCVYCE